MGGAPAHAEPRGGLPRPAKPARQEGFERQNLTMADLSSDAPWVQLAAKRNAGRVDPQAAALVCKDLDSLGVRRIAYRHDQEPLCTSIASIGAGTVERRDGTRRSPSWRERQHCIRRIGGVCQRGLDSDLQVRP